MILSTPGARERPTVWLWLGLLGAVLAATGCGGSTEASAEDGTDRDGGRADAATVARSNDAGSAAVPVVAREVVARTVVDEAVLPGDLEPRRRAVLAAEVAGRVEAVEVDDGSRVAKGAALVRVDREALAQRVAEAEAMHRLRTAQFDRADKLLARRSVTQAQFLEAKTQLDVARAQLETAKLTAQRATVYAPWRGVVARRLVETGDYVTPGQPVAELVEVDRLEVRAVARASDVPFLRSGLEARIEVDVFAGETFTGLVRQLGTELDPSARTLDVVVDLRNVDGRLKPGLAARVYVPRRRIENAILVPLDALVELEDGAIVYVVADDGRAERRSLTLGPVLGDEVVIEQGIVAGERVITVGLKQLSPGQRVSVDTP